jgi:hypothetical protein
MVHLPLVREGDIVTPSFYRATTHPNTLFGDHAGSALRTPFHWATSCGRLYEHHFIGRPRRVAPTGLPILPVAG